MKRVGNKLRRSNCYIHSRVATFCKLKLERTWQSLMKPTPQMLEIYPEIFVACTVPELLSDQIYQGPILLTWSNWNYGTDK